MKHTVVLTGASGGIGSSIAKSLAGSEYDLVLCYNNNKEQIQLLEKECSGSGSSCLTIKADLCDEIQINEAFYKINEKFGSADIIINNAAISWWGLLTEMSSEQWDKLFNINVRASFLTIKNALPAMINSKFGRIINISSMWGQVGASCEVAYSAAKGALIAMTKALAKEVGPSGITVNCIAPGVIDTKMNSALSPQVLEELKQETPMGRIGTPEDIASMVKYLLSPQASFITGQVIGINGGYVI